jgi:hypothetical protein
MMSHPQTLVLETMKKAAAVLEQAGIRFALTGGVAAYARGAAPPVDDIEFVILPEDADAAAVAFAGSGLTVARPPEGWLVRVRDNDRTVDLIHVLSGMPVTGDLLDRAEWMNVAAVEMRVLGATDLVLSWLRSLTEHDADFALTLTCVRPLREQVDWGLVREATADSAFAHAFLVLLEDLQVIAGLPEKDNLAGHLEHVLATDPRTNELGVRVELTSGVAFLHGEVAGERRRELVGRVAEEVLAAEAPGVALRNEVTLTEMLPS